MKFLILSDDSFYNIQVKMLINELIFKLHTEIQYEIRNLSKINDLIVYSHSKLDTKTKFNEIDAVFVQMNKNLSPWSYGLKEVILLMKQCIQYQKPIFGTGNIFYVIIYILLNNCKSHVDIINGRDGSTLQQIIQFTNQQQKKFLCNDTFLDNTSGNLYQMDAKQKQLIKVGNVGLILNQAEIKVNNKSQILTKSIYEKLCNIKPHYQKSELFENIKPQFYARIKNKYFIDQQAKIHNEIKKLYEIIAECEKQPCIIKIKEHQIICLLEFHTQYKEINQIVKNFIQSLYNRKTKNDKDEAIIWKYNLQFKNKFLDKILSFDKSINFDQNFKIKSVKNKQEEKKSNKKHEMLKQGLQISTFQLIGKQEEQENKKITFNLAQSCIAPGQKKQNNNDYVKKSTERSSTANLTRSSMQSTLSQSNIMQILQFIQSDD